VNFASLKLPKWQRFGDFYAKQILGSVESASFVRVWRLRHSILIINNNTVKDQ
jgi:hypothetical protein